MKEGVFKLLLRVRMEIRVFEIAVFISRRRHNHLKFK